jgi:hypothetical protein
MRRIPLLLLLLIATPSLAGVQRGQQVFNKIQIGLHPLGFQVDSGGPNGWYKFAFDFSGRLGGQRVSVWLGGGLNYAFTGGPNHDVQPWMFIMLTFERLINIPLVPLLQFGLGSDVFIDRNGNVQTASLAFRVGVGFHYWLTRNVGVGVENHFTAGPQFDPNFNPTRVYGYGTWDMVFGVRFAF